MKALLKNLIVVLFMTLVGCVSNTFTTDSSYGPMNRSQAATVYNTSDKAQILYVNYVWSSQTRHDKVAIITGEVRNNLEKTIDVVVTVTARNSEGRVVDTKQVYAPLVGSIPPKSTGALKTHFYDDGRGISHIEVSIAQVYER